MQFVNLYLPEFRPRKIFMSARQSSLTLGIVCLFVLVLSSFLAIRQQALEAHVIDLENRLTLQNERVDSLKKSARPIDLSLDERIASLRLAIMQRKQIKSVFKSQDLGNINGFSSFLIALSETSTSKIALERFRILNRGEKIEFSGEVKMPQNLTAYLDSLQKRNELTDVKFGSVSLVEDEKNKSRHRFVVGYEPIFTLNERVKE